MSDLRFILANIIATQTIMTIYRIIAQERIAVSLFVLAFWIAVLIETEYCYIRRLFAYIRQRIEFRHEARQRREAYQQFKADVKSGLTIDFEDEAREVIK